MSNDFPASNAGTTPAQVAFTITPDDNNDLPVPARALLVGVGGDINCIPYGQTTAIVIKVPAGVLPLSVRRVLATNTDATGLVGLR